MTKDEMKDEMKNRISMALKDPILQMGFEIICKNLAELEKENAELDCQMNRNKYCYSCANVTDRCFRNEIGCPCEKYKSYKGLNKQLTKAKELIKEQLSILPKENIECIYKITEEAEQFISEVEECQISQK